MSRKGNNKGQLANGATQAREESRFSPQQAATTAAGGDTARLDQASNERQQANEAFSSDEVAARAYQIFEREGRTDGRDMDHWLQAERELRSERQQRTMTSEDAPRSARQTQR